MTARILVVDDEGDVRLSLRLMLERQGWDVEEAASGEEALARCQDGGIDMIVLDYKMPGLSGVEVARTLRDQGFHRPIVLYSAYLTPSIEKEAEELRVWAIAKEDVQELMETLRDIAPNSQRRGERG